LELVSHLMHELKEIAGIRIFAEEPARNLAGIVSFTIDHWQPEELGYILRESFDICVRTGLHCAPLIHESMATYPTGTVRVSLSPSNTITEIDQLIRSLRIICQGKA
jgi:cysteine desulfurase / selenocysteine lyase